MTFAGSTNMIIGSFVLGLPFLWFEHPLERLGQVGFYSLATAMLLIAFTGFTLWAIERK